MSPCTRHRGAVRLVLATLAAVALLGCRRAEPVAAATVPPRPALQPLHAELLRLVQPPIELAPTELQGLRELAEVALHPEAADARTLAHAERALLEAPHAAAVLGPALADLSPAVRARAVWLGGRLPRAPFALALLLRLKDENDPTVWCWLAEALHRHGNDTALPLLGAAMARADGAELAARIAIAITADAGVDLPETPTWAQLQQALDDLHGRWRRTGVAAGTAPAGAPRADDAEVQSVLATHLLHCEANQLRPVDEARYVLVRSGRLGLPLLRRALGAQEPYLRTMGLIVAAELGPVAQELEDAILPLVGDPLGAAYAVRALGEIGATHAAAAVRTRLQDSDAELRAAAAASAGLVGDREAAPRLQQLLADRSEPLDVRVQAAFGLLLLGPHPAADAFLAERERLQDYHQATLVLLRERLAARAK